MNHDSFRIEYRVDGVLAHSGSVSSPWALVDYSALPGNNVEFGVATICGTETSDPTMVAFIAEDIEKYNRKHVLTASISLSPESPVLVEAPRILSVQTTGASRWEFFVDDALVGKGDRNLQRAINLPACIADAGRFSVLRLVAYTPTSETSDRTTVSFPGCPVGQNVEPRMATVANNLRTALGVPGGLVARIGSGSAGLPLAENRSHCSMPASVRVARGSTGMVNIDWPDSISNPYLIYNWQIGVGNGAVAAGITVQNRFSVSSVPESVERLNLMLIIGCPLSDGSVYISSQMYELHIEPTANPIPQEVETFRIGGKLQAYAEHRNICALPLTVTTSIYVGRNHSRETRRSITN